MVKNCDQGLKNGARSRRPGTAFSRPRSQFFTIRTDPWPVNNILIYHIFFFFIQSSLFHYEQFFLRKYRYLIFLGTFCRRLKLIEDGF